MAIFYSACSEVRLPPHQRVLCSDCCKNVGYYV